MSHWLVFYRTMSGKLSNFTCDAETAEGAMQKCSERRGFKDFERTFDGRPIIKRKVYMHEMWR